MVTNETINSAAIDTAPHDDAATTVAGETSPASEKQGDVKQIIGFLAEKFPLCFSIAGEAKPLKIGIFKDLTERVAESDVVSRTQLRQALRRYTSSWRYLKCVAKGGLRVDLDGQPGEALQNDHIEHAAKALEESKARFEKTRKVVKDKKIYKKAQKETGETSKKQAKLNVSSKSSKQRTEKVGRSDNKPAPKVESVSSAVNLLPLTTAMNTPGTNVLVKFGHSPVPGVIKDVNKSEIHVQLNSGMVIKTKFENIYLA